MDVSRRVRSHGNVRGDHGERVGVGSVAGRHAQGGVGDVLDPLVPHRAGVHRVQRADPPGVTRGTVGQREEAPRGAHRALGVAGQFAVLRGVSDDEDGCVLGRSRGDGGAERAHRAPRPRPRPQRGRVRRRGNHHRVRRGWVPREDARQGLFVGAFTPQGALDVSERCRFWAGGDLVGARVLSGLADMSALVSPGDDAAVLGEGGGPHDGRSSGG
mmetsp:Transcript_2549/g.10359  ORF Transcript_2549/g.10359 Transcript_2549/m.10359 type:complete len:215 (-) Transcript_2549:615-1259(-)